MPYWRLSGFYFAYFALLGGVAPFLALYFAHLGYSPARIGELIAIPMLMRCLAPSLWGWLGDRSGNRLLIVRAGALLTAIMFSAIFWRQDYLWLVWVMASHSFFWHAILPQFEAITLEHLGDRSARYAQIRLWGSIGFIATVIGLGGLMDVHGLGLYPAAMMVIMVLISVCSFWVPRPTVMSGARVRGNLRAFLRQLRQPGVVAFFVAVALMQLSHGPYYTFLSVHLETLGYSRSMIGLLWALGVVAEIVLFMLMVRVLAWLSLRQLLIGSLLLAAVRWVLIGTQADQLGVLLFAQLLHAATFGSFHVAAIHFVQRHFSSASQGQGQALYASLSGVGGACGALYAGYSWHSLGPAWTFAIASVAVVVAAILLLRRLPASATIG
ncbi:MFS transporter [Halopseudomonas salegens]|uniref:MFS transporter, PPP family, 3-phenylpropionic acid transporter n=1 Tax=Halopseudomonas salegens TaxID=1434072 RepID=A0A1H2EZ61_9GAMM|nr:MFS transporter [Halopseudomonas salegens]SDU00410.1 MFS transporter, PPP family, 3-phenylpropionic acid transporter [Halopseudomonas salegens]